MPTKWNSTPEGCPEIKLPLRRKKVNIYADFETFLWTNGVPLWEYKNDPGFSNILSEKCEVVPWLLGAQMPAIENNTSKTTVNPKDYRGFFSAEFPHPKFFELIKEYWDLGYLPVIWFHNTTYDLTSAIETAFMTLDPDLKIYFTTKENKAFINGLMESPKYGFKAKFGDTLLYKKISLEKIGEILGEKKGEIPYTMMDLYIRENEVYFTEWLSGKLCSVSLKNCVDYVMQDVHLLRRYHEQLTEETELITIAVNGYVSNKVKTSTQGVHARSLLDIFMQRNHDEKYENTFKFDVSEEEGKLMQRSLTGGYTSLNSECFSYICKENELITLYDCNSLYPFIMTGGVPYGRLLDHEPDDEFVEWVCISAKDVRWVGIMKILKTPPIPVNKQTYSFDKPTKLYVTRGFLNFVQENAQGEFVEHYSKYQKITYIAGAFVNYLYNVRKQIKKQHEELKNKIENDEFNEEDIDGKLAEYEKLRANEEGVKTTMNSLYGKMCEKIYLSQIVYLKGKFRRIYDDDVTYKCTLTGAYIAMTGRMTLYRKIKQALEVGFQFLYADTDSVIFAYNTQNEHLIEEVFGFNNGELGEWKNEGHWHEFHSPGKKKKYTLINYGDPSMTKIKLSGVSKRPYIQALKNGLYENMEQTIEDLRYIFNPTSNVLFRGAKNNVARTFKYDQQVIYPIDVCSNISVGYNTGEVFIEDKKYILKKYDTEREST